MSLPMTPTTTCDIYRFGTAPPAAPAVAAVPCVLRSDFANGARVAAVVGVLWTHVLLVDRAVDIRDGYTGGAVSVTQDTVWVPDGTGTKFRVVFIETVGAGNAAAYKRVYLDRGLPTWPTDNV